MSCRYWIVRKTVCIVGYYGGLRNHELRSLAFGKQFPSGEKSLDEDESGFWFVFERAKQRGMQEVSSFCVPRRKEDWIAPASSSERNASDYDPASVIDIYLAQLESDFNCTRDQLSGPFFKSAQGLRGKIFKNSPMGKNKISEVGREFAEELCLPNAQSFTGHCWRRSCGTSASNAGVNVTTLMAQMGWTTPKTAIGYIKKSRMTSFQMSMFLTNVQRRNKDLDCLDSTDFRSSLDESKKKTKKKKPDLPLGLVSVPVPVVNEATSSKFLQHLTSARNAETVSRTRESANLESEKANLMEKIISDVPSALDPIPPTSEENSVSERDDFVGHDDDGGVGGIEQHFDVDPRVSSIMRNFQNNGTVNVHFHFSK
jgi:hypothetical protein